MIVYTEFATVAADLGIPIKTLFAVSNSLSSHYKKTSIPKKNGGMRELTVPDKVLKRIQRAIAEKLLSREPISPFAMAYRFGASVQKNAKAHVGREKLLKLDIRHFFDSILYSTVKEKCFPAERYSEPIRILLSMLCYFGDSLPQGAPSSPAVTNIIMRDLDMRIGRFCAERGITYTRYCDDMAFSGSFDEGEVTDFVRRELFCEGFLLNTKKTRVITSGHRMEVTGIVVNDKLSVRSEYKRQLRSEVYYCLKYGASDHISHIGYTEGEEKYLRSLLGRINFVLQASPQDKCFSEYKSKISELLKKVNFR